MSLSHVKKFAMVVVLGATVIVGAVGSSAYTQQSEAASVTRPVAESSAVSANALPSKPARHAFQSVPFYWAGFYNWDGRWCTGLFSDSGRLLMIYSCN